jgi:hypothetical protein
LLRRYNGEWRGSVEPLFEQAESVHGNELSEVGGE